MLFIWCTSIVVYVPTANYYIWCCIKHILHTRDTIIATIYSFFYIHPSIRPSVHSSIHILSMYTYRRHVNVCVHMIISKCIIYIYYIWLSLSLSLSLYIYKCIVYIHVNEHHGRLTNGAAFFFEIAMTPTTARWCQPSESVLMLNPRR
jgi:hypothetical protein